MPIECKIPLNFEFEFKIIKPDGSHPDLRICPLKGIVPGRGSVEVDIEYSPTKPETMVVEAELSISQFGFEPIRISITGSGQYAEAANQRKAKEMAQLKKAEEEKEARKKKHAFRLRSTKGRNKSQVIGTTEHKEELNTSLKAEPHELEEGIEEEVRKR